MVHIRVVYWFACNWKLEIKLEMVWKDLLQVHLFCWPKFEVIY